MLTLFMADSEKRNLNLIDTDVTFPDHIPNVGIKNNKYIKLEITASLEEYPTVA